jgi:pimeloyl-ACP methyl ester carboxylesterase
MRNCDPNSQFLFPPPGFSVTRLHLNVGNMRLVHGGQGPALILVHGLGGSCEDFYLAAPLLARSHTVYIPDLPGFGDSEKPNAPYSMDWFLQILQEMHGRLGLGPSAWLGHSMGGLLSLLLAARLPGLVERTVAVCPGGGHKKLLLRWRLLRNVLLGTGGKLRFRWAQPLRLYFPLVLFFEWSQLARDFSRRFIRHWNGPQGALLERSFVRAALSIFETPIWPEIGGIASPVLMMTGRHDWVTTREQTSRLARHLPPERHLVELGGGHMLPYTHHSELCRAALDFLHLPR